MWNSTKKLKKKNHTHQNDVNLLEIVVGWVYLPASTVLNTSANSNDSAFSLSRCKQINCSICMCRRLFTCWIMPSRWFALKLHSWHRITFSLPLALPLMFPLLSLKKKQNRKLMFDWCAFVFLSKHYCQFSGVGEKQNQKCSINNRVNECPTKNYY